MTLTKRWPDKGRDEEEIQEDLDWAKGENLDYGRDLVIGFPGTEPAPIAVDAFVQFLEEHPNNITTHTGDGGEIGFAGTHALERNSVFMVADFLGSPDPRSVHGYISPGGTESNIMGVLLGREHLRKTIGDGPVAVMTSIFGHYSIRKAAWVLGLGTDEWRKCERCSLKFDEDISHFFGRRGVDLLGTDEAGRLSVPQLVDTVLFRYAHGVKKFIIVISEGNIMTGAVDDTRMVGHAIETMKREMPDAGFYLHVDACYGGFVVPFLDDFESSFSFHVPQVDSVAIDVHKMGEAPYPAGMFIYRRDGRKFRDLLGVQMGYVPGGTDGTLCGSRPGASAAACYAVLLERGDEGYRKLVADCMAVTEYLAGELEEIDELEVLQHDLNIVAFRLKDPEAPELPKKFLDEVKLVHHRFPDNFIDPNGHVRTVYKATLMRHVTKERVDEFIRALRGELKKIAR